MALLPAGLQQPAASWSLASEGLRQANAVLARRTGEVETGIKGAHIVLIIEVRAVERQNIVGVRPGQLRVQDVALAQSVAKRRVLEQGCPLRPFMAEVNPGCQRVATVEFELILCAEVEREIGRVGLLVSAQVDA